MKSSPSIKVLIVDDHQVVREGLRRIMELDDDITVIGEASNGEEAISQAVLLSPDVIVMDLKMPEMDGISATTEIKKKLPEANILVLTLFAEGFIREAFEAGASGYILKDSNSEQISNAIHQVNDCLSPIAPSLSRGLVVEFAALSRSTRSSLLTKRQKEILMQIANGVSSWEISNNLFISRSTVKREIRNIFNKLGVNDRSHAVSQALKRQLI